MIVKFKILSESAKIPKKSREGDAGLDLHSDEELVLSPGKRKSIGTGIACEIPKNFVGLFWDRGGWSFKHGLHTLAGVIDSNYRGELKVIAVNLGAEEIKILKGDRIAQLLVQPVSIVEPLVVKELSETNRGAERFGSSGM
ncbi:MAG: dUTP diphosphatase [Nanoarchaeota archaeon]|nr:dUTP diphosphatase [Nanoarchaeota archaeon]